MRKMFGCKQVKSHSFAGTFTLSNLGMFGVDRFDAILPPGQVSNTIVWLPPPPSFSLGFHFFTHQSNEEFINERFKSKYAKVSLRKGKTENKRKKKFCV